jgi:two-component system NarL family response regulator
MRVLLVDPSEVFRIGLRSVLSAEPDVEVVGEAADGDEAIGLCKELAPDVVVLELRLGGGSGVDVARSLLRTTPELRILMLTWSEDEVDLRAAVRAGSMGYLLKDVPAADLAAALRTVALGRPMVSPALAPKLMTELATAVRRDAPRAEGTARLTERELEVLRLVARGMSNRSVADTLFLSENTVKNHVRNILDKLESHSRMEAVVKASKIGLLQL